MLPSLLSLSLSSEQTIISLAILVKVELIEVVELRHIVAAKGVERPWRRLLLFSAVRKVDVLLNLNLLFLLQKRLHFTQLKNI